MGEAEQAQADRAERAVADLESRRVEALLLVRRFLARRGADAAPEARRLLADAGAPPAADVDDIDLALAQLRRSRARSTALLDDLARALALPDVAVTLLAGVAMAQLDSALLRLWEALRPAQSSSPRALGAWIDVLADRAPSRLPLIAALDPAAPLRRLSLIELEDGAGPEATRGVRVPDRVVRALLGVRGVDGELPAGVVRLEGPLDPGRLVLDDAALLGLARARAELGPASRVIVVGEPGSGRSVRARILAADRSPAAVLIDGAALPHDAARAARALGLALREAVLERAAAIVRLDGVEPERLAGLGELLAAHEQGLFLVAPPSLLGSLRARFRGAVELAVEPMSPATQHRLWERALGGASAAVDEIIAAFDLRPGDILAACDRLPAGAQGAQAAATAATVATAQAAPLTAQALREAVRAGSRSELWGLATPCETPLGWDDVVLPEPTLDLVREIVAHARHRAQVFDGWGFSTKIGAGRSLSALFHGPSGTGKTLVATVIGKDLGRDVYRVDLSRVVDKFVGETEKNLGRLFVEAARSQAILLFDEADSLFARRTRVDTSNDRYANLAVNFLLQQMDSYDGVCLLTTNFAGVIDEAFRRRLRFTIEFPRPDARLRERLWRGMFPPGAPLDGAIRWDGLAAQWRELNGGHIRNVALRAAFLAAAAGRTITQADLDRAAAAHYEAMGYVQPK